MLFTGGLTADAEVRTLKGGQLSAHSTVVVYQE